MQVSQLLRTARTEAGLTLRELAARSGTSHSTLAAYETGAKTPKVATLNRILHAAGFALDATLQRRHRGSPELTKGDELIAVLELAAAFPARHTAQLEAPVFAKLP